jgi:hypothetical protein
MAKSKSAITRAVMSMMMAKTMVKLKTVTKLIRATTRNSACLVRTGKTR